MTELRPITEDNTCGRRIMNYPLSEKYDTPALMAKIMGPNPLKLEELLLGHRIPAGGGKYLNFIKIVLRKKN